MSWWAAFKTVVVKKKKPSRFWSIFYMVMLLWSADGLVTDIRRHDWLWIVIDVLMTLFSIFVIYQDWAWYPEKKSDEDKDDLNKTKELRDTWKEKL